MGNLFGGSKKKAENKQQLQQQKQPPKSAYVPKTQPPVQTNKFQSERKELTAGEKQRMKLQHHRDQLKSKQEQIEIQITAYENEIRQLIAANKREQAKFVVQRKMLYDKFLSDVLNKIQVIHQSIITVDQLQSDKEMADIIESTNEVMKDISNAINMSKLQENLMDMQQMKQDQQQMNGMFQQYQVDDEEEVDAIYNKYLQSDYQKADQQPAMRPLAQQQQQQQPQQQQFVQPEKDANQDRLAMLE